MRLFKLLLVTLLFSTSAPAGVTLQGERPISEPTKAPAAYAQTQPAIASDGNDFLVAWSDSRFERRGAVRFAIVDYATLTPHHDAGVVIPNSPVSGPIDAFWLGGHYVVLWSSFRGVSGVRISAAGELIDAEPRVLLQEGSFSRPAIAMKGNEILTIERILRGNALFLRAARFDAQLERIGSPTELPTTSPNVGMPEVVATSEGYFATWSQYTVDSGPAEFDLFGVRLDAAGIAVAPSFKIADLNDGDRVPHLASDGTNVLLVWFEGGVRVLLVDQHHVVRSDRTIPAPVLSMIGEPVWNGHAYLLPAAIDAPPSLDSYIYVIEADGSLGAFEQLATGPGFQEPARIGAGGATTLAVLGDARGGATAESDLTAVRIDLRGRRLNGVPSDRPATIAFSARAQYPAVSSFDGSHFVTVWSESESGEVMVNARRFTAAGEPDGPVQRLPISEPTVDMQLIFNGREHLFIYRGFIASGAALKIVRLGVDAAPLDVAPRIVTDRVETLPFDVATNGVWTVVALTTLERRVGLVRIDENGAVHDSQPLEMSHAPFFDADVTIASDGNIFLFAWAEHLPLVPQPECPILCPLITTSRILARHFYPVSGTTTPEMVLAAHSTNNAQPNLTFGRDRYLLTWIEASTRRVARIVDRNGAPVRSQANHPGTIVVNDPLSLQYDNTFFNGEEFAMMWQFNGFGRQGVLAATIREDGRLTSYGEVELPAALPYTLRVVPAAGPRFLMTYSRTGEGGLTGGVQRTFLRSGEIRGDAPITRRRPIGPE